jgi:hypothetical protein
MSSSVFARLSQSEEGMNGLAGWVGKIEYSSHAPLIHSRGEAFPSLYSCEVGSSTYIYYVFSYSVCKLPKGV